MIHDEYYKISEFQFLYIYIYIYFISSNITSSCLSLTNILKLKIKALLCHPKLRSKQGQMIIITAYIINGSYIII